MYPTVTTNVNWQTSIHTDKGDDSEGFGNLVVLEEEQPSRGSLIQITMWTYFALK